MVTNCHRCREKLKVETEVKETDQKILDLITIEFTKSEQQKSP